RLQAVLDFVEQFLGPPPDLKVPVVGNGPSQGGQRWEAYLGETPGGSLTLLELFAAELSDKAVDLGGVHFPGVGGGRQGWHRVDGKEEQQDCAATWPMESAQGFLPPQRSGSLLAEDLGDRLDYLGGFLVVQLVGAEGEVLHHLLLDVE